MKYLGRIFGGYMLSGLNLGITLLIINERGAGQAVPAGMNLINGYFMLNALVFFPVAYLIVADYRSKRSKEEKMSNIQKAFKINGESFATSNFIPAYLYHGTVGGSTAAIFFLYYIVFLAAPLVVFFWLISMTYKLVLSRRS
ncbi:hypothetical protein FC19_GL000115 [Liquorilactobacillus aquaticus DSM 21051]|uniref:Uncharacterized protein n=1 Tax=Liquorilactobacillus aquaticus DSM 21051 TaxID=1423725 RepID=A0A0R2CSW3_9LACO|nr:hypothetical protein [Liquorilactobacillus aquaticus]KRM94856.1 hypothetical protein FC19_GL000115 [Liquorilactobacillus aquaticus DSM 21051]